MVLNKFESSLACLALGFLLANVDDEVSGIIVENGVEISDLEALKEKLYNSLDKE